MASCVFPRTDQKKRSVESHCANIHLAFVGRFRECRACHDSGQSRERADCHYHRPLQPRYPTRRPASCAVPGHPNGRSRPQYPVPRRLRLGLGAIFSLYLGPGLPWPGCNYRSPLIFALLQEVNQPNAATDYCCTGINGSD